ncbi:hypothetical protein NQ318_014212 [Aromia moschata]|uniref:Uncharacterized protein n=1 Tax=Aromia moschata TaxID=1265417 RepID=A0AAV8YYY3_9CUCU|nr:hypothetical protein NQ318_014212 [Aromia moschata]
MRCVASDKTKFCELGFMRDPRPFEVRSSKSDPQCYQILSEPSSVSAVLNTDDSKKVSEAETNQNLEIQSKNEPSRQNDMSRPPSETTISDSSITGVAPA